MGSSPILAGRSMCPPGRDKAACSTFTCRARMRNPLQSLEEFRADPNRFDVIVLDQIMPGLTGTELARQMRHWRTDVPVVLISGYSGPVLAQQALSAGIDQILTKPLDLRQIAEAMSKVLSREKTH